MEDTVKDKGLIALARFRDEWFADLIAVVVGIAVERHPEAMKAALSTVFDLSSVEESERRMMLVLSDAQAQAQQARQEISDLRAELDQAAQRMDSLLHAQKCLEARQRASMAVVGRAKLSELRGCGITLRLENGMLMAGPRDRLDQAAKLLIQDYRDYLAAALADEQTHVHVDNGAATGTTKTTK